MAPSTNRSGHRPFKAAMLGSNPAGVTNIVPWCSWLTYLPVTQEIAGSIPVGTATRPLSLIGQDAGLSILKCRVQTPQGSPILQGSLFGKATASYAALCGFESRPCNHTQDDSGRPRNRSRKPWAAAMPWGSTPPSCATIRSDTLTGKRPPRKTAAELPARRRGSNALERSSRSHSAICVFSSVGRASHF